MVARRMKNRYIKHSHITEKNFRLLLKSFCEDNNFNEVVGKTKLSRSTISKLLTKIRERIVEISEHESPFSGEVEVDESYFGPRRIRGKRGRGAGQKVPVVGVLKRGGKVYTRVVRRCTKEEILPIIRGKILEESEVYTDGWRSYDGLIYQGYKHYRIYHSKNEFALGKKHINGIESFWSFTKRRLVRKNGVRKDKFLLHLKESEFRWNYREVNTMYKILLASFRCFPL